MVFRFEYLERDGYNRAVDVATNPAGVQTLLEVIVEPAGPARIWV